MYTCRSDGVKYLRGVSHLEPPCPVQGPDMKFPGVWTRVPKGALSLRKKVLSQRDSPGRGCREVCEFRETGPFGPIGRNPP